MKTARRWRIAGAAAVLAVGSTALAGCSGPTYDDASEIVPSFAGEQAAKDHLPEPADTFIPEDMDPAKTRLVGQSADLQYFAAPLGDEEICLIPVNGQGDATMMGCTSVDGFGGLRVANGDKTEEAWLVATSEAQEILSGVDQSQWEQKSPNLLVKNAPE
ncbi:hypothetical protein [Zhihengliuella salsuginis]|uniref:Lipoprotein n=1 Tax=Zhihengliuella salsuginis TaxID=578222 RepID=A0ABQ3GJN0_9MICC|nr:hypothetical protein [Zhihengliuella salsuginis]GHD11017.1 hypothetical protein GCM10008096_25170 [Zhihengliuella salsuginis]